ncbi:guanine nucleotide exchange protein for ADP-robosylation factor [Coelomomyces lativittatus]|nr:guanine nucleotide exchange protein for ADP-robosylation factor [Coelomomyces lativittatus]KAJ1510198.1 guanine nucleotide exchange protein for ADP-robosylation factor [Coelomomyces lativittatus]KAJ1511965.1 guanine nucleotide exchange protein for ADP-robosylation factor [Coelomomyces lativittatus]
MNKFVDSLDFTGMTFVEALRYFLQYFRLPGESQKIDRYMLKFAERYYNNNKHQPHNPFANADTAYVLAYSVIMLNTDLHNPQVKRRMSRDDFIKNNRGINDNADLPLEVLNSIYDAIEKDEIKLKDDPLASTSKVQNQSAVSVSNRARKEVFNSALEEILNRIEVLFDKKKRKPSTWVVASHSDHVKNMMDLVWMAVLASLSTLLQKSDDVNVIKATLDAFKDCIAICCNFDLDLGRSAFITTLSNFTLLTNANEMKTKNFGAIKILLDIALQQGNSLKRSWLDVLKCISQLEKIQVIGLEKSNLNQSLQQETSSQSIVVATDKIFSASVKLSGPAIVDFVSALCTISNEEIPRMFSLTKLVEISYYNMQRIRLEWVNIWNILGNHFNVVACKENEQVSFFALDSLRQLSMKFLEKEELSNFRFQREFLRPFEHTVSHHSSAQVRDFVIRCLQQMVQARSGVLRSGWKTILSVFTIVAGQETSLRIFTLCYDVTKLIMSDHLETILHNDCFSDAMDNLLAFCKAKLSQKISLQAVESIHRSAKALTQLETLDEAAWFSLFYALSRAVNDCELEVRTRALQYLFTLLKEQGSQFSLTFWHRVSSEILFELFSPITKPSSSREEELSVWLSTTMVQALRQFLDLFGTFYTQLAQKLPDILVLIKACVLQENEMLARLGSSCLQQLMENNCHLMSEIEWAQVCICIAELFQATEAHALFDPSTLSPSDTQATVFQQILVNCVLQLLLIQTLLDTIPNSHVYSHIPNPQLFVLIESLEKSYQFSKKFNGDLTLRTDLWKCGFTNKLPNLVKQETSSLTCILHLLFQIYCDTSENRHPMISKIDEKLITLALTALETYRTMDVEDRKRNMAAWKTVLLTILKGLLQLHEDQFQIHIKKFYSKIIDLLLYDLSGEVRAKLHAVLSRTETYLN